MKLLRITFKYLKNYPALSLSTMFSIAVASFFEGITFGMLIPLIQSMTSKTQEAILDIPFVSKIGFVLPPMNQKDIISAIILTLFLIISLKNAFAYLSQSVADEAGYQ